MFAPDSAAAADAPWPELDRSFLQKDRRAPPPFPLDVIAAAWWPWIEGHARASTCVDYVAQALLAAVSTVCGSRFVVDVTPHWREPLVLWQALVGAPSTGKTPALVAARRLIAGITAPPDVFTPTEKTPRGEPELTAWLLYRGMSRWHDDSDWLAEAWRDRENRALAIAAWTGDPSHDEDFIEVGKARNRFAESIFGTLQADRLAETLTTVDEGLLSRFLYCWPVPRLEVRLDRATADAADARPLLQRLVDLPGTTREPAALGLDEAAVERLQDLLPRLRAFMRDSDGVEAAWIGKGVGNIVRLAGLLSLMDWAATVDAAPCTAVGEGHLERAHALWTDYFWPHAQAVFGQAAPTIDERRVRRVGQWLRRMRPQIVSREEVRREALAHAADAEAAERIIERLEQHGVLRMLEPQTNRSGGPRRRRWQVNPELWGS